MRPLDGGRDARSKWTCEIIAISTSERLLKTPNLVRGLRLRPVAALPTTITSRVYFEAATPAGRGRAPGPAAPVLERGVPSRPGCPGGAGPAPPPAGRRARDQGCSYGRP